MQVLLFGIIAEKAGMSQLEIRASSTFALRQELVKRVPETGSMVFAIAVDREITHADIPLTGTEEIAVLPPFAGG